jgi:urease accessory protein UreH
VGFLGHHIWSITSLFEVGQIYSDGNLTHFDQTLQNKEETMNLNQESFEDGQISHIQGNLTILGKNASSDAVSTVETNCENNSNNATKTPNPSTVDKDCGKTKKSPDSDNIVIATTVEEVQKRVNQIIETKQERLERINRQKEKNLKKVKTAGEK